MPHTQEDVLRRNQASIAVTRRGLLHVGISGAFATLAMAACPLAAGLSNSGLDFGPGYAVRNVEQIGRNTHVELEFQVNGRSFKTQLWSTDRSTWRPV